MKNIRKNAMDYLDLHDDECSLGIGIHRIA